MEELGLASPTPNIPARDADSSVQPLEKQEFDSRVARSIRGRRKKKPSTARRTLYTDPRRRRKRHIRLDVIVEQPTSYTEFIKTKTIMQ